GCDFGGGSKRGCGMIAPVERVASVCGGVIGGAPALVAAGGVDVIGHFCPGGFGRSVFCPDHDDLRWGYEAHVVREWTDPSRTALTIDESKLIRELIFTAVERIHRPGIKKPGAGPGFPLELLGLIYAARSSGRLS